MEKLKNKLKTSLKSTLIFGIISASWIAIDFLALQSIYSSHEIKFNFEWIILIISSVPFILFHLSAFFTLFYAWKFLRKSLKPLKHEEITNHEIIES